jgi:hypothetical protein
MRVHWMHAHPFARTVNNGNSGDSARFAIAVARAMLLNASILRRWETIASVRATASRLSRYAAAAEQDTVGR